MGQFDWTIHPDNEIDWTPDLSGVVLPFSSIHPGLLLGFT